MNKTHGKSKTKEFQRWQMMLQRCDNPKCPDYPSYGGRGIIVDDLFKGKSGFMNFIEEVGEKPEGFSLDRIDNNKGYVKGNIRWANIITQNNNKSTNRWYSFGGIKLTIAQWSKKLNIPKTTIKSRLDSGKNIYGGLINEIL